MASATVKLTLSPVELQIVDAALGVYSAVCDNVGRGGRDDVLVLKGYRLNVAIGDGNPDKAARMAREIQRNIGLK